jgi:hypothetical protein
METLAVAVNAAMAIMARVSTSSVTARTERISSNVYAFVSRGGLPPKGSRTSRTGFWRTSPMEQACVNAPLRKAFTCLIVVRLNERLARTSRSSL